MSIAIGTRHSSESLLHTYLMEEGLKVIVGTFGRNNV